MSVMRSRPHRVSVLLSIRVAPAAVLVACLFGALCVTPLAARADTVPSDTQGKWSGTTDHGSALFSKAVLSIAESGGTMRIYAAGGRTTCRARLVFIDAYRDSGSEIRHFGVRFLKGAPRSARAMGCSPSRSNGARLNVSVLEYYKLDLSLTEANGNITVLDWFNVLRP